MLEKRNNHKHLRKEITNATFSEIIRILKYKCLWLNKIFIQISPYYASSQICSRCKNKENIMKDIRVREYKCSKCGWGERNPYTGMLPLEIEHIDGNYLNNDESNLLILCPNGHSLTSTYKGANIGKGRKNRKIYS